MYNRYIGNTGKYYRVDDAPPRPDGEADGVRRDARREPAAPPQVSPPPPASPPAAAATVSPQVGADSLRNLLKSLAPSGVDIGDIILLLLLALLYIDSGDDEFLVTLGFMVFAILKKPT